MFVVRTLYRPGFKKEIDTSGMIILMGNVSD